MERSIAKLASRSWDLLVLGGGIAGACVAHDAVQRGLRVALVERRDFGGFTSAASSKLIHGGIRYLPGGRPLLARASARERAVYQNIAPHLTRVVPFLIPSFDDGWLRGRAALSAGMLVYESICLGLNRRIREPSRRIPRCRRIDRHELIARYPALAGASGLSGAGVLHECHLHSSERATLAFVASAAAGGACVANYVEAEQLIETGGRVSGARLRDVASGESIEVNAALVVNATGPFIASLNRRMTTRKLHSPITALAKGLHLVTRAIHPDLGLGIASRHEVQGVLGARRRNVFVIPWRGHSLIGTTNAAFCDEDPDALRVTRDEVEGFVREIAELVPGAKLEMDDVRHAFAGLYPLTAERVDPDTYQGSAEHVLVDHEALDGLPGLISLLNAKFTTARSAAERCVDLALQRLGRPAQPCRSHRIALVGGNVGDLDAFARDCARRYAPLARATLDALIAAHGRGIEQLLQRAKSAPELLEPIGERGDTLAVQVVHAVEQEMARTLSDVVFRRTGLGTLGHPGERALRQTAERMAPALGWSAAEIDAQIAEVESGFPCVAHRSETTQA